MKPKVDLYLVVYNCKQDFKSGLKKVISITNKEGKEMTFLDKDTLFVDGLFDIGTLKEITMSVTA